MLANFMIINVLFLYFIVFTICPLKFLSNVYKEFFIPQLWD